MNICLLVRPAKPHENTTNIFAEYVSHIYSYDLKDTLALSEFVDVQDAIETLGMDAVLAATADIAMEIVVPAEKILGADWREKYVVTGVYDCAVTWADGRVTHHKVKETRIDPETTTIGEDLMYEIEHDCNDWFSIATLEYELK